MNCDHDHQLMMFFYLFWQVMLFGHDDSNLEDKSMKVTVAFNYFGPGLVQRMPR